MTPVPATVSPSGEDRNKVRDVWPRSSADRSPESAAVRETPRPGSWSQQRSISEQRRCKGTKYAVNKTKELFVLMLRADDYQSHGSLLNN